jgi:hypothetical protein
MLLLLLAWPALLPAPWGAKPQALRQVSPVMQFARQATQAGNYAPTRSPVGSYPPSRSTPTPTYSGRVVPTRQANQAAPGSLAQDASILVQGGSLRTWSYRSSAVEGVQVQLHTEGRPFDADVELWHGPDDTPCKMRVYVENGQRRPFNAVIATPRGPNTIALRNIGQLEFPFYADVIANQVAFHPCPLPYPTRSPPSPYTPHTHYRHYTHRSPPPTLMTPDTPHHPPQAHLSPVPAPGLVHVNNLTPTGTTHTATSAHGDQRRSALTKASPVRTLCVKPGLGWRQETLASGGLPRHTPQSAAYTPARHPSLPPSRVDQVEQPSDNCGQSSNAHTCAPRHGLFNTPPPATEHTCPHALPPPLATKHTRSNSSLARWTNPRKNAFNPGRPSRAGRSRRMH